MQLLGNMGFILLGARALEAINVELSNSPARLQWFIPGAGAVVFAFSYLVPTILAMRKWLAMSAALTVAYDVTLLAILVKDDVHGADPRGAALDTRLDEGMFSGHNLTRRLGARGLVLGVNVFVTALFPFMADFVDLFGSFALVPLTFVFPSILTWSQSTARPGSSICLMAWMTGDADQREEQRTGDGAGSGTGASIIVGSMVLVVATTVRLIFRNPKVYHFFADM
ncbi:hypothetical protein HU200_011242 [Digitaria exilis]|uniref:Amino acid transporter transmembrane domain-containing protein n=1 Tax=Digitaria exilis TaxID=1010633 RepID=A0A835FHT2_9POAL|nr:hypothetical protein HU200_011242 [Digitaria exilis]